MASVDIIGSTGAGTALRPPQAASGSSRAMNSGRMIAIRIDKAFKAVEIAPTARWGFRIFYNANPHLAVGAMGLDS